MTAPSIITVHGLLRYMERVHGIDVRGIEAELIAIVSEPAAAGAHFMNRDGFHYVFKEGKLVTVSPGISRSRERQAAQARQRTAFAEARACR